MIELALKNKHQQQISGKIDHEKESQELKAIGTEMAVLTIKDYTYLEGDYIHITTDKANCYLVVQLDETLAPTLIYLTKKTWSYLIPIAHSAKKASVETAFSSKRHHLVVRKAYDFEINHYQNLSINPHDQKEDTYAYPHATANVETRDDVVFFAKNAIDGKYGNLSHGSYPYNSWGINQQAEATLTIEFGRVVEVDWIRLLFRADYPHDSHWKEVTLCFSNGEEKIVPTTDSPHFQELSFSPIKTTYLTLKELKKAPDASPFPALTQIEIFGKNK
ncbi:hypothetical protein [Carnobacterium divergens]|uniref:hypothetical protein n=1 Tax=Carnobacterium divergens TaxID=2748 RepID=UPI0039AF2C0A